jgi:hypothetical protein
MSLVQVALFNISRHLAVNDWLVVLRSRLDEEQKLARESGLGLRFVSLGHSAGVGKANKF